MKIKVKPRKNSEKYFCVKPVINKKNGQVSISLPKKKLSPKVLQNIKSKKKLGVKIK